MNPDKTREDAPMPPKEDQITTTPEEDQVTMTSKEDQVAMTSEEDQVTATPKEDRVTIPHEENQINKSYWPVLRKILEEDPSGMDRVNLECMMCKLPMSTKANEHVKVAWPTIACTVKLGLPFACPLNACGPSSHPECGCSYMGWPFPERVEDFGTSKRTTTEGLKLKPKCFNCASVDVLQSLTLLTGVLKWEKFKELKSVQVAYRIQLKHKIWGAFEGDKRESAEIPIPASMHEHCRNVEASLATLYSCPSQVIGEGDLKIRFFEYSGPLDMIRVRRRLDNVTAPRQTASDQTTDETRQSMSATEDKNT
ncbi:hypothetical protein MRS44_006425 [Fusarium solani]|uniref:uncharacterized protein n=1 Tax=Fusarium solani TaxID=169388 RepID=UPI0032C41CEC|nr:hypothetical protein MRS44_006425 [Fusarium solani]